MATVTSPETLSATPLIPGQVVKAPSPSVPRLHPGDHLTRAEFERRYDADPEMKKAELLEGVVYMPSPVRHAHHGRPHFDIIGWLARYRAATPPVEGGDNSSLRLDLDNVPQPDGFLFLKPEFGGQVRIDDDGYIVGAPEHIAEVAASSVSYDLHIKLQVYRRSGVKEYMVWRVEDQAIDWFFLHQGRFDRLEPIEGVFRSLVFPGLWLDSQALISGDMAKVAQVLDQGLATQEHREFVERLRSKQ